MHGGALTSRLEDEAITIIREVAAECERPVLLFSGGKDSVAVLHLARRAFWPAGIPFPVMHVDTGHNFDEVIEFRDRTVAAFGVELVVASVQASIDEGRVRELPGPLSSRNQLQTGDNVVTRSETMGWYEGPTPCITWRPCTRPVTTT